MFSWSKGTFTPKRLPVMQREHCRGEQHPELKQEHRPAHQRGKCNSKCLLSWEERPTFNEKSMCLKMDSGVLPSLPSSKERGKKKKRNMSQKDTPCKAFWVKLLCSGSFLAWLSPKPQTQTPSIFIKHQLWTGYCHGQVHKQVKKSERKCWQHKLWQWDQHNHTN